MHICAITSILILSTGNTACKQQHVNCIREYMNLVLFLITKKKVISVAGLNAAGHIL